MDNEAYLEAYVAWKDQVNTEDQDTPQRFAYHLKNLENQQKIDALLEYMDQRLDELESGKASDLIVELIPVATLLGMDTKWYEGHRIIAGGNASTKAISEWNASQGR